MTSILHDNVFANDFLNQTMDRHEIPCGVVVVVVTIDINVLSNRSSDKRKFDQYANRITNSVNICVQIQHLRLAFEQGDRNCIRMEKGTGTYYQACQLASLVELFERNIPHGGDIVRVLISIFVLL